MYWRLTSNPLSVSSTLSVRSMQGLRCVPDDVSEHLQQTITCHAVGSLKYSRCVLTAQIICQSDSSRTTCSLFTHNRPIYTSATDRMHACPILCRTCANFSERYRMHEAYLDDAGNVVSVAEQAQVGGGKNNSKMQQKRHLNSLAACTRHRGAMRASCAPTVMSEPE